MSTAWIMGAIASALGIGVGGGLAWLLKGIQKGFAFTYSLCAGLIIGLLCLEMIPESIELGGWIILIIGLGFGLVLFHFLHQIMNNIMIITNSNRKEIFIRSGTLLAISIAIHNFPVGIALGSTLGTDLGGLMLTTLILHNIPEGIIVFTPLFLAGFGLLSWILITILVTFPIAVGSLLGQAFHINMPSLLALLINLAIAIIFMVAIREIFLEAVKESNLIYSTIIGLVGVGIIYLYMN
jgi:zinc transporter, ZIP family